MAVTNKDLNLTIKSKYDRSGLGTATQDLQKFGGTFEKISKSQKAQLTGIQSAWKNVHNAFSNVSSGMLNGLGKVFDTILSVKTAILALFAGIIGKGIGAFIGLNAEFEKIKVSMDVLTKGQGEAWFNKLNQWALDMPVSMAEVSKAFITMQAYGLTPTTEMMENLINVASVLPESGRAITGIARAIGQIQAKGRLEGQELRQLAEWAVPGYEAVYEKIFKKISERTGKSVHDLKFTMIDAATAQKALLEAMEEHFGGAADAISKTWGGLWIRLTNHVKEFFRQIGESGAMQPLKEGLKNIVDWMSKAFKSGEMQKVTNTIGASLSVAFKGISDIFSNLSIDSISWGKVFVTVVSGIIVIVGVLTANLLQIKLILLILKEAWAVFGLGINLILGGIMLLILGIIKAFKWLVDLLPTSLPGVEAAQSAFGGLEKTTKSWAEAQGENILLLNQMANEGASDIIKTGKAIGSTVIDTKNAIKNLLTEYDKMSQIKAVPPKTPTVTTDTKELSEYEKERAEIINSITSQEKGWGKTWMNDMETSIIDNASAWEQVQYAFRAYEKEGLKGATFKRFQKVFQDFTDSLKTGYSSAISGMIRGTMNLRDAINSIVDTIRASFINVFADMVGEWLAAKTRMLLGEIIFQKEVTAATVEGEGSRLAIEAATAVKSVAIAVASGVKKIMIFAYQAAAAVYNAFAFLPLIGPALGIAAVGGTLALLMGFAKKVASFEKGTGLEGVKQTGPAVLHKGEIVLNKKESDAYRAGAMEGGQAIQKNEVNLSFTIQSMDSEDMERVVRKKIIPIIRDNIRDNGRAKTMVREAT